MPRICPDILQFRDPDDNLRLSVLVIDLCLALRHPGETAGSTSKRCGSEPGGLLQLEADLRERAEALAARMASPKTINIITFLHSRKQVYSLDVLTGKTVVLDSYTAWGDDGRTVEEDSESEFEFPDNDSPPWDD